MTKPEGPDYAELNPERAQQIHDLACETDPEHDGGGPGGCWCCCLDCDFDFDAVMGGPP